MADANHERVIASFYGNNGTETQVRGRVIQILFQNQRKIYELMTDSPVHFRIRDAEIKLEARRHTQLEYSLFVSAEQCAPETTTDTVHTKPVTQPQHNSHSHSHSQTPSRPSRYKKGDLVTLPVEEVHSGVINGTVGYTGRHNNMDVVEICADPNSTTYSVISKIRNKFEVPRFPDEQRLNAMKGFSLVVRSDAIIPNDFTTSSGDRNQISTKPFPETVGYAFHENPQPGNPPYNTHERISNDSAFQNNDYCEVPQFPSESGNHECQILSLSNDDPIAVVTDYGELKGRFRVVKVFERSYHIGIELDRPPPGSPAEWKTPDGVLHEKRIFNCRPGHGCLVHISRCVSRVQQRDPNVPLVMAPLGLNLNFWSKSKPPNDPILVQQQTSPTLLTPEPKGKPFKNNPNLEFPDNSEDISIDRFRDNLPSVEEFNLEQLDPADPERYVETVQENVRVSKERINELFNLAHQKLEGKKLAMFENLDNYVTETNKRVADLLKTRAQFVKAMEDFDTTLNVNTANDAKVGIIKIMKESIIKVDKQIENLDIHRLEVIENTGDDNIKYPCYVSKISRKFRTPKWCSVDKGTALDQLYDPHSIAIDPAFNRMYLADHAMHRIQVFNCLGTYIETFSNAHISLPVYVSLVPSGLLVSSPSLKKLVSISKENGAFQREKSFPQGLIGIDYDETTQLVYACTVDTHRLYCLDAELNIRNETQLESAIGATHLRNRLAVDCKVRNGEIYVLFPYRENPVHVFTLKGRLKRSMLTRDYLHLGFRLCLTQTGDMVVSDLSGMQVKIFSQEGDPVRMIGQNGEGKGRLYQPTGVAVTAEGLIVVCDLKPAFMLQAF